MPGYAEFENMIGPGLILLAFLSSVDFFKNNFLKKSSGLQSVSNCLDPDQARQFFGPDLAPDCLQSLSADDKSHH